MIGVRSEVEARAGGPAQCRGEAAEEVLSLEDGDLLTALREREPGSETADAAAYDDRVGQASSLVSRAGEAQNVPGSLVSIRTVRRKYQFADSHA